MTNKRVEQALEAVHSVIEQVRRQKLNLSTITMKRDIHAELAKTHTVDGKVMVDGVELLPFASARDELLAATTVYAAVRWQADLSSEDAALLLGQVATEDLPSLAPIVVDQHFDDGRSDPLDDMDEEERKALRGTLVELGLEIPEL